MRQTKLRDLPENNCQHWFLDWILNQKKENSGKIGKVWVKFDQQIS